MLDNILTRTQKDRLIELVYPAFMAYRRARNYPHRSVERALVAGQNPSESHQPSVLYFTTHRCASTFTSQLLDRFGKRTSMLRANFDSYLVLLEEDVEAYFEDREFLNGAFYERGLIYGPFRSMRPIPNLPAYRILLVLRDPRDILVSTYFSLAYSHGVTNRKLIRRRRKARSMGIDSFVLNELPRVQRIFEAYSTSLLGLENVSYWRYADIIDQPETYLRELADLVDPRITDERLARIAEDEMTLPEREDRTQHRRSGKTRQFEDKLQDETVDRLNDELAPILRAFEFPA